MGPKHRNKSPHSAPRSTFEAVETARSLPFGARPPGRREGVARAGRLGPCVVRASVWARGRLHTQVSHGNVVGSKLCVCVKGGPLAQQTFVNAAKFCEVELRVPEGMSPSILQRWCRRACRGLFGIALGRTRCTVYRHRVHWCEVLTASIDASRYVSRQQIDGVGRGGAKNNSRMWGHSLYQKITRSV